MPECWKCGLHIRRGTLCEIHAVEQRAAGVDLDHDADRICAGCGQYSPNGGYSDARPGMWFCPGCSSLELRQSQRVAVAAETPDALNGAVRWAVGNGDDDSPDADPGALEAGFETASTRVAADGGQQLCGHCHDSIDRGPDDPPLTFEGEDVHWDCLEDALEAADDAEWGVEQQGLGHEPAQGQATVDGGIEKSGGDR